MSSSSNSNSSKFECVCLVLMGVVFVVIDLILELVLYNMCKECFINGVFLEICVCWVGLLRSVGMRNEGLWRGSMRWG